MEENCRKLGLNQAGNEGSKHYYFAARIITTPNTGL